MADGGRAGMMGGGGFSGSRSKPVQLAENQPNPHDPNRVVSDVPTTTSIGQGQDDGPPPYNGPLPWGDAHDFLSGTNEVCPASLQCSVSQMVDYVSRFGVPGQDPSIPVVNRSTNFASDPRTGFPGGYVKTTISQDGLTVSNKTTLLHFLYNGQIVRTAHRNSDGSWSMSTHGFGNNWTPGMNRENQDQGPKIFDAVDQAMRAYILRDHGRSKSAPADQYDGRAESDLLSTAARHASVRSFEGRHET